MRGKQFGDEQAQRVLALLERYAWGDIDGALASFEEAFGRAVAATWRDADRWDNELEVDHYVDENSVTAEELEHMDDSTRLAYVGRLIQSLALCYGAHAAAVEGRPQSQERENSLASLLRGLNDISQTPVTY